MGTRRHDLRSPAGLAELARVHRPKHQGNQAHHSDPHRRGVGQDSIMLNALKNIANLDMGSLFASRSQLLGLDIGSSAIKVVQMKQHKGRYQLQKFGTMPLEPEVIVDGTVMDQGRVVSAIKDLLQETNVKLKDVAMSISGH